MGFDNMEKMVDGVIVQMTESDIAEYNAMQSAWDANSLNNLVSQCTQYLGVLINSTAFSRGYTDAVSCTSYVTSTNIQWSWEAIAFIQWRDDVLDYAYDYYYQIEQGTILNPTLEDFSEGLPQITWP